MKILLINPPYRTTDVLVAKLFPIPLGLLQIATVLKQAGHDVTIKDFLLPFDKVSTPSPDSFAGKNAPTYWHNGQSIGDCVAWLKGHTNEFDVIGMNSGQCNIFETVSILAEYIRDVLKKPLVIGGAYVTTDLEGAQEKFGPAVYCFGEGEGIAEDAFTSAYQGAECVEFCKEKPQLQIPDYSFINLANYPKVNGKIRGVLQISRGCPWECKFCAVAAINGRKHRRMTDEQIRKNLLTLFKLGARYICFIDDNLFVNEKALDNLEKIITDLRKTIKGFATVKFYVEEGIEVRVAAIPGFVERIYNLGFKDINLGLETMNAATLSKQKKPYRKELLMNAINECRKIGVTPKAFYIIGLPGDTVKSVAKNILELASLGVATRANNLKIWPGTQTNDEYREAGIIKNNFDYRLSSFYTPDTDTITYKQIRKLKVVLGAIGYGAENMKLDIINDPLDIIVKKFATKRIVLEVTENEIELHGKMFRATPYQHLAFLLALRFGKNSIFINDKQLSIPNNSVYEELSVLFGVDIKKKTKQIGLFR